MVPTTDNRIGLCQVLTFRSLQDQFKFAIYQVRLSIGVQRIMRIRSEEPADVSGIRAVNLAAFETKAEADLVDSLREHARPIISLVAEDSGVIVGHILFSPVTLDGKPIQMTGLAPMAVVQASQRHGIGSALVGTGLDACKRNGVGAVVVLGHATYYPRFGFMPASRFGLRCHYDVPDEVFMVLELTPGVLHGRFGMIQYHPAFANV
jgi:putative acetyltransferase